MSPVVAPPGMSGMWFWILDTSLLSGFGSGACLVSFYLRVGGGIFSKGADLGRVTHDLFSLQDSQGEAVDTQPS